jgi:hypothetical protein
MREEIEDLREHAQRCRRLARAVEHPDTEEKLEKMAREFEATAAQLEANLRAATKRG